MSITRTSQSRGERAALGIWLGRRQEPQAEHRFTPTLAGEEPALAEAKVTDGIPSVQHP
ncbi:MAG: hypothetical protein H7Y88_06620 [Phycisphaerales bacterium]|nr:hypothetical protein [Phycisphaerales bacterium]